MAKSDRNIIAVTFELIQKREHDIAIRILDFFTRKQIKHATDSNRRIMVINRAQAHRWSGNPKQCYEILDTEDWSSCEDRFKLGVAALREDFKRCYTLVRRIQHDEDFDKSFYKDWPIFRDLRNQEEFRRVYEDCYGEPLAVEQTTEDDGDVEQDVGSGASEGGLGPPPEEPTS